MFAMIKLLVNMAYFNYVWRFSFTRNRKKKRVEREREREREMGMKEQCISICMF